ncbi:His-Xaa-Ser system radical SAM maturase HxsC [Chitinophaga terrae (ex Kim and Jung 2007)]|uniref:His-Xaa-Ser system radical SAM maturase HxsC n=1 Tax=Chitinophaga terrae (ex Kim and Jung 2007) TaxID=408074 RepID=A0A1H3X4Y4_9BACT|nr:His-Xaa-Ser system radical SAM maturase HxsC [Chitinophaga terrae (ex Kim and Jung 2007)]SDZ93724.1 His-Xaa-Ser system radical SAM maturase HxsC [Chitinophaga terrae (ex Kim and Jung 2007)]
MLLKTKGIPSAINAPIIGRVTFDPESNAEIFIITDHIPRYLERFKAIISTGTQHSLFDKPLVYAVTTTAHLSEGDIVVVNTDGVINTLYRKNSNHNFLLFTERCNSNCLMCSQPPKNRDDTSYLFDLHSQTIPLISKDCLELGITGGEPTLLGELFFRLLEQIQVELPETEVHCLTNGRSFAWPNFSKKLGSMAYSRLMLGIPLYSDYYAQHDYIVQAKGAFNQTVQGLYNLAKHNVRLEIRVVLHKQTIPRLGKLSQFIYKNLPFVEQVVFMGLEHQGYTPHNMEKLWVDPNEYGPALVDAMMYLSDFGINTSLYNAQLCTTPQTIWPFTRKSISDWKNIFHEECSICSMKQACGGFFASSTLKRSSAIKAFPAEFRPPIGC